MIPGLNFLTGTILKAVWRPLLIRVVLIISIFLLLAEATLFVPSVGRYHNDRLVTRLAAGQLAALALEQAGPNELNPDLKRELLASAAVRMVALKRDQTRQLYLAEAMPPMPQATFETRDLSVLEQAYQAFETMFSSGNRVVRIVGRPKEASGEFIEAIIDERPLREDLWAYAWRIASLSFVILVFTAVPVYAALHFALVTPIQRLVRSMMAFQERPDDAARIITPMAGGDEIARASHALATMQRELNNAFQQRARLAALGLAVAKIQHDLRNILATAQLTSDRLASAKDPEVQKLAPRLVQSIDRAVALATKTLKYGRAEEDRPRRRRFPLAPLAEEVAAGALAAGQGRVSWSNLVPPALEVDADSEQLLRILLNIGRNAVEALEHRDGGDVRLTASREGTTVTIDVADNGPGLPPSVQERLFEPFQSRGREGGTGLGLAIARELARGHGGEVTLSSTGEHGTTFRVTIPDTNGQGEARS